MRARAAVIPLSNLAKRLINVKENIELLGAMMAHDLLLHAMRCITTIYLSRSRSIGERLKDPKKIIIATAGLSLVADF